MPKVLLYKDKHFLYLPRFIQASSNQTMGQEFSKTQFSATDKNEFQNRLAAETSLLHAQIQDGAFSEQGGTIGFETECVLVDSALNPAPQNTQFFAAMHEDLKEAAMPHKHRRHKQQPLADLEETSPELARFDIEFNSHPEKLISGSLARMRRDLEKTVQHATSIAQKIDTDLVLTGILPTIEVSSLDIANMSDYNRYHVLNQQLLTARQWQPVQLEIDGKEYLHTLHNTVMPEAASTSFQLHLQVPVSLGHFYYNASLLASGPVLASACNSPWLFGRNLWQETRIPLFEQSVNASGTTKRVGFGTGFCKNSITECFQENLNLFPALLPILFDEAPEKFSHLRVHNGCIWRWNRPLVGFDRDGRPHIRIEHRTLPAGPSLCDMMANAAFFYGLCHTLATKLASGQVFVDFRGAESNFYQAARYGLQATMQWPGQKATTPIKLLLDAWLPMAAEGLQDLGLNETEIQEHLSTIAARVLNNQTGASWQEDFGHATGNDFHKLVQQYMHYQKMGQPVHTWPL